MQSRYQADIGSFNLSTTTSFHPPSISIPKYKILLLGCHGSGRTSLFIQYCTNQISNEPNTTDKINIGMKLIQTIVDTNQDELKQAAARSLYSIQLYDTPVLQFDNNPTANTTTEQLPHNKSITQSLIESMLRKHEFDGVCIVVSCIDLTTFSTIAMYKLILQQYYQNDYTQLPAVLCASKADLVHEFTDDDINDSAQRNHILSGLLVSTDTNATAALINNIELSFMNLINCFIKQNQHKLNINTTEVVYNMPMDTPVSFQETRGQLRTAESNLMDAQHPHHISNQPSTDINIDDMTIINRQTSDYIGNNNNQQQQTDAVDQHHHIDIDETTPTDDNPLNQFIASISQHKQSIQSNQHANITPHHQTHLNSAHSQRTVSEQRSQPLLDTHSVHNSSLHQYQNVFDGESTPNDSIIDQKNQIVDVMETHAVDAQ